MGFSRLSKTLKTILLVAVVVSLAVDLTVIENLGAPEQPDSYSYKFIVGKSGSALVSINYTSSKRSGSSWVIVPKFLELSNRTRYGRVLNFNFSSTKDKVDVEYYFYRVLDFSFQSNGYFEMILEFNFTSAAMIIEPNGIFLSPQVGFKPDGNGRAEVVFPLNFSVGRSVAGSGYLPSFTNSNYVRFDNLPDNDLRMEIQFRVSGQPDLLRVKDGIFTFETVRRYENHAREILDLFDMAYGDLVELFNTTLQDVHVEFFIPDFENLLTVGGYVPFTSEKIGDIHINIFYTRYVKGYIEVAALHELVHHFIWKKGLLPYRFLWFHEGMAQYISMELANDLGYEGAVMMKQELEDAISQLNIGGNLGFLQRWTPSNQPESVGTLYTAAYYVVTRLAEPYGGLKYYARVFRLLSGANAEDNNELAYYMSLAANTTVVPRLKSWGFQIVDLYRYSDLIAEAERSVDGINLLFQPYKFLAEQLYKWALTNAAQGRQDVANTSLLAAMLIAELSPLLMLLTVSTCLFVAILYGLKRKGLFSDQPL